MSATTVIVGKKGNLHRFAKIRAMWYIARGHSVMYRMNIASGSANGLSPKGIYHDCTVQGVPVRLQDTWAV